MKESNNKIINELNNNELQYTQITNRRQNATRIDKIELDKYIEQKCIL
jgi:hypothetical protein